MDITLPAIPAGVTLLLGFFAPYAIAIINHPAWPASRKRLVAIIVSVVLAAVVLAFYYLLTGELVPDWPVLVLLALVVVQAAYTLLYRSATEVEQTRGTGRHADT